jgi:hypothetical protein
MLLLHVVVCICLDYACTRVLVAVLLSAACCRVIKQTVGTNPFSVGHKLETTYHLTDTDR